MSRYKSQCRKFQANIFNKSKCTNCFQQREEHSSDALDCNRASRKVSKCGYLFVAPDWDFTIPLYRTKRWQRRWFVLYDDGELTYSVDDLPATIPQGVIDMSRVLEVTSAEDVTGNQYSLAITAPDRVTFVKGTCMEESRWWQDVLSVFPRMHKHGRHKRNATFPGIKGSCTDAVTAAKVVAQQQHRTNDSSRVPSTLESPVTQRVRFHSISSEHLRGGRRPSSAPSLESHLRNTTTHHSSIYSSRINGKNSCSSSSTTTLSSHHYDSVNESSPASEDDDTNKNNQKNSYYSSPYPNESLYSSAYTSIPYSSDSINHSPSTPYQFSTPIATPPSIQHHHSTPTLDSVSTPPTFISTPNSKFLLDEHKENTPPYSPEYTDNPPTSESPPTHDKISHRLRTRRALNREARALSQPTEKSSEEVSLVDSNEGSLFSYILQKPTETSQKSNEWPTNNDKTYPRVTNGIPSNKTSIGLENREEKDSKTLPRSSSHTPLSCSVSSYLTLPSVRRKLPKLRSILKRNAYSVDCDNSLVSLDSTPLCSIDETDDSGEPASDIIKPDSDKTGKYSTYTPRTRRRLVRFENSLRRNTVHDIDVNVLVDLITHSPKKHGDPSNSGEQCDNDNDGACISTDCQGEAPSSTVLADLEASKREEKLKDIAASITTTSSRRRQHHLLNNHNLSSRIAKPTRDKDEDQQHIRELSPPTQIRGAPDGCGGSEESHPSNPVRVDLPSEDLLYIKKGWLLTLADNKEWNKYWFVLHGSGLRFYRNSDAEDSGILDGIIDLNTAKDVHSLDVSRNYGFVVKSWSEKQFIFSAVTAGIRNNWVQALRNAANIKTKPDEKDTKSSENDCSKAFDSSLTSAMNVKNLSRNSQDCSKSMTNISLKMDMSSDEEYKTSSENSNVINCSHEFDDLYEADCSRSRPNSCNGRSQTKTNRRTCSSPPITRKGTASSSEHLASPSEHSSSLIGLNKNILDRYKNMQNMTGKSTYSLYSSVLEDNIDGKMPKDNLSIRAADSVKSLDFESTLFDKMSSSGTLASGNGESLLVDLLETQVESLRAKLEATQADLKELHDENVSLRQKENKSTISSLSSLTLDSEQKTEEHDNDPTGTREKARIINLDAEKTLQNALVDLKMKDLELLKTKEEMAAQNANLEQLRNELEETQHHLQEFMERRNSLETEHLLLQQQHSLCDLQLSNAASRANEVEEQKNEVEEARRRMENECQRLREELTSSQQRAETLKLESDKMTMDFRAAETSGGRENGDRVNICLHRQPDGQSKPSSLSSNEDLSPLERLQTENLALKTQLYDCQAQLTEMKDSLKAEKKETYKWKDLVKELKSLLEGRSREGEERKEEVLTLRNNMKTLQQECDVTRDKLQRGIEENEALNANLCEMRRQMNASTERTNSTTSVSGSRERFSSRRNLPRLASLSDLTNVDLSLDPEKIDHESLCDEYHDIRARLEKSISEIRALKRELRESQASHDSLQVTHMQLSQDSTQQKQQSESQLRLMTERLQDLTNKLSASEKQVRQLKTKNSRTESRERRRSHSLRGGRDPLGVNREVESKLTMLEATMEKLLPSINRDGDGSEDSKLSEDQKSSSPSSKSLRNSRRSKSIDEGGKMSRSRRKSLESSASNETVRTAVRINNLESKIAAVTPVLTSEQFVNESSPRSKSRDRSGARTSRSDSDGKLQTAMEYLCQHLSECLDWTTSYSCSCGKSDLSSLVKKLEGAHHLCLNGSNIRNNKSSSVNETVQPLTNEIVKLLQSKLTSLAERRQSLKSSNAWTKDAQMKNFAERIAYETVLISNVCQGIKFSNNNNKNIDSVKLQDLIEAHRKMAFLEKKLTNPEFDLDNMAPIDFYTSMLAEKLVVTGEVMSSISNKVPKKDSKLDSTCKDLQSRLIERESKLARIVMSYKDEKLHEVAVVMAQDINANVDENVLMEEVRIREAWNGAHHLLMQQIVNLQTSQSLFRLSNLLNAGNPPSSVSLTLCSAEAMDRLQMAAEESLRQEMEESVLTLSQKYEEVLAQYRNGDTTLINSVSVPIDEVLNEFAGIMAQKALIDGHLALLQEDYEKNSSETLDDEKSGRDLIESCNDIVDSEAHLLMFLGSCDASIESIVKPALSQSELTYIFNKCSEEGSSEVQNILNQILSQKEEESPFKSFRKSLLQLSPSASDRDQEVASLTNDLPRLVSSNSLTRINISSPRSRRKGEYRKSRRSSDVTGMTPLGCRQCEELKLEVNKLHKRLDRQECLKCPQLLDTITRLEEAQRAVISKVENRDSDEQLTELKQRLLLLEECYEEQILALKQQYEEALASQPSDSDETTRNKYQKEIAHLRDLCEKGLGTMESSQRRLVSEIEEKHRRELSQLQEEKEQALAEETQATLAALDAMRKAHEADVAKEVAKIKDEMLRDLQNEPDISLMNRRHEEEMKDIRAQILSLSEKYSDKCLESSQLEQKVETLTKLLAASRNASDTESRGTKMSSHFSDRLRKSSDSLNQEYQKKVASSVNSGKEKVEKTIGTRLEDQYQTQPKDQFARSFHHQTAISTSKLDQVLNQSEIYSDFRSGDFTEGGTVPRSKGGDAKGPQRETRPILRRPKVYSSKELTRSPSCPRLGHSPRLVLPPISLCDDHSLSPLYGMVASMKRVFEMAPKRENPQPANN